MARENLLNLEAWCRWSYVAEPNPEEEEEDEEEDNELSALASSVLSWQKRRQDWVKQLKQAKSLRAVADVCFHMSLNFLTSRRRWL